MKKNTNKMKKMSTGDLKIDRLSFTLIVCLYCGRLVLVGWIGVEIYLDLGYSQ